MRCRFLHIFIFLLICSVLSTSVVYSQDFSNKGKDFWVAYTGHIDATTSRMALYLTSEFNTTGTVSVGGFNIPFTIKAYTITTVQLTNASTPSNSVAYNAQVEGIGLNKGIHITSGLPIVVYSHILNAARSGSTLVLPTNVLGREYIASSYKSVGNTAGRNSEFAIIATEDNTTIEITPTDKDANNLHVANTPFQITLLNKGDVYQYQSAGDITGTQIKSIATSTSPCKRIAVYSGSTWTALGCSAASSGDNLYQQLFPTSSWGKTYYTAPAIGRSYDIFRVIVQDTSEPVYVNGVALSKSTLINARFYEINTSGNNTYRVITSAKPISVLQYFITQNCDNVNGDPEMIILNPIEQTLNDITVMSARNDLTPPATNITGHYLNIIFKSNSFSSLKIDGAAPKAVPKVMGTTGYSYIQENVTTSTTVNPSHRIVSDSGFLCIAYGFGNVESYGYNAGANVKDLYQSLTLNNPLGVVKLPATCKGTPVGMSITLPYIPLSLKWIIPGNTDTVMDNNPIADSTYDVNGKTIYRYTMNKKVVFNTIGTFTIQVIVNNPTSDGCSGEQEVDFDITIYGPPNVANEILSTHCISDSIYMNDQSPITKDDRAIIAYNWDTGDGIFHNAKNYSILPDRVGKFNIKYFVITDIGCLSDTLQKEVIIDSVPAIKFKLSDTTCINKEITLTDLTPSTPNAQLKYWYWDLGDGSPLDTNTASIPHLHTYTQLKNYTPKLGVETLNGCKITDSITFTNRPNPVVGFSLPAPCLDNALATFNDTSSIADNNLNFNYLWNFGDPGSGTFNTDTKKMPTHKYSSAGNYNIILQVATAYGCVALDTSSFTVSGSIPHPSFNVLNSTTLCTNQDVTIQNTSTIDFGTIDKLIVYWDNDHIVDSTIVNNPAIGDKYNYRYLDYNYPSKMKYNIRMRAFSGTCFYDTIVNIQLVPHPQVGFILPEVCLADAYAEFLDTTKISDNSNSQFVYKWNFNVTPPAGKQLPTITPGSDIVKNPRVKYNDFGIYQVSLQVTQKITGCVSSVISDFTVNGAIPKAKFRVLKDTALCTNEDVRIENLSTVDFGTIGKLIVYWDATNNLLDTTLDEFPSIGKIYAHRYAFSYPSNMKHTIKLAASSGGVCANDTSIAIQLVSHPNVKFTIPDGCLLDAMASFTDQTTIDDKTNNFKYLWHFDDAVLNTATTQNASHKYSAARMYSVQLQATSLKGCVDSLTIPFNVEGAIPKTVFAVLKDTALCSNQNVQILDSSWVDFGLIEKINLEWGDGKDTVLLNPTIKTIYDHYYASYSVPNNLNFTIKLTTYSGGRCATNLLKAISIVPPPNVPVISSPKPFLCWYDSLQLHSSTTGGVPPFIGKWTTNNTNASIKDSMIYGLHVGDTKVSLEITDRKKCVYPNLDIFSIPVIDIPVATIAAVDTVICNGDSLLLTGAGANLYKWYVNDTLLATTNVGKLTIGRTGDFKLVVNDGSCNSLFSSFIRISALNIPKYAFSSDLNHCVIVPLTINTNTSDYPKIHFKWTFGDNDSSLLSKPISHSYLVKGNYVIKLNVTNDWCPKYEYTLIGDSIHIVDPLNPTNFTMFILADVDSLLSPLRIDSGYINYAWNPNTYLNNPFTAHPIFRSTQSIIYTLSRMDPVTGCKVDDIYKMEVSPDVVVAIPKAFTPNGDNLNDLLKIEYGAGLKTFNSLKIFNRFGKIVYQTNRLTDGWDGKYLGIDQEMDAYTYLIDYITYKDEHITKTGSFILLR
jgi:gliding motility-associated-like protein